MSAEILDFAGETTVPIPCERVLEAAKGAGLSTVIVIGRDEAGKLYMAASHSELGELLLMLKRTEMQFLAMAEMGEG